MASSPSHKSVTNTIKNSMKHEKSVVHMLNGCQMILNTAHPLIDVISRSTPEPTTMTSETPIWEMTTYKNRLRTFNREWKLDFITPNQMANAGFYYMGRQDCVRCMYCSKTFDYWQRGENPFFEHKRKSPQCPFFKECQDIDVCGSLPDATDSDEEINKIQHFLESVGVIQQIKVPKHKKFTAFETRFKTFDKCEKILKQDIHTLCEAGFYYIGNGQDDQVLCFCCSQGLKNWDDDDEPWTEHARWSPTCSYVLLSKGKIFVDKVCGVKNNVPKMNQSELSQLIADHKNVSIVENSIKVNLTKRKLEQSGLPDISKMKLLSEINIREKVQLDPNTMPDSMLCKICYKEEIKVAFIPCGHVIACIQCTMKLDQCAICRQPYNMAMRVYVQMEEDDKDEDFNQLPSSSSQCADKPLDPMLCKLCHKEEMQAAFVPCKHVYACIKCATEMHECPVCTETFCATMQVYL